MPTSVILNWEMELKKWAPGFKILTYYGSQKERKVRFDCDHIVAVMLHACVFLAMIIALGKLLYCL